MHIFTNDSSVQSDVDTTRDGPSNPSGANDQTSSETYNITDTSSTSTSQNNNDNEAETPEATSTTQGNTEQGPTDPHPAEAGFSHIINFLYECLNEPRVIKPAAIHTCTKQSSIEWLDHQHSALLSTPDSHPPATPAPLPGNPNTETLTTNIGSLTTAMAERQLSDLEAKQQAKSADSLKKFENLAPITKNTTILCTAVPDMHQDELHEIEMNAVWASLIGLKSSTTIVRTIEHVMRNCECLVYLQKGLCNDFRHGTIASSPDPFERNGLCVFLMAPEETTRVKEDRLRGIRRKGSKE